MLLELLHRFIRIEGVISNESLQVQEAFLTDYFCEFDGYSFVIQTADFAVDDYPGARTPFSKIYYNLAGSVQRIFPVGIEVDAVHADIPGSIGGDHTFFEMNLNVEFYRGT